MLKIGNKIRDARKRRNFTQHFLADRVGISQSSLSLIESGETEKPLVSTLRLLAYELADDFGDPTLREYLAQRKDNPATDLSQQVVELIGDNDLVLGLFVIRLARAIPAFRQLLDPQKLAEVSVEVAKGLRMVESIQTGILASDLKDWFFEGLDENRGDEVGPMKRADMIMAPNFGKVGDSIEIEEKPKKRRKTG